MENILCPHGCGEIKWNCNCSVIGLQQEKIAKELEKIKIFQEKNPVMTGPTGMTGPPPPPGNRTKSAYSK